MNYRSLSLLLLFSLIVQDVAAVSIQTLIDQNKIPQITGPANRKTLNLAGLKIDDLTGLSNIPNIGSVHVLILNRNSLKVIRAGDFSACTELQSVGLRFNLLAKLEPGSFTVPRNLQAVRLGHNKLKTIPDGVFDPKLAYLGLAANPISKAERAKLQEKLPKTKIFFLPTTPQIIVAAVGTAVAALVIAAGAFGYARRVEQQKGMTHELVQAATRGDNTEIANLINDGASVNTRDFNGETPLTSAAYTAVVRQLLAAGAEVDLANLSGDTPLMKAAKRLSPRVVKLLLDAQADVNAVNQEGETALTLAVKVEWRDDDQEEVIRLLLDSGRLTQKTINDAMVYPTFKTIFNKWQHKNKESLLEEQEPQESGGNISAQAPSKSMTPAAQSRLDEDLAMAARTGQTTWATQLLERGANVDAIDPSSSNGDTPLMSAALGGDKELVELLLFWKANVNAANREGQTPLILAAARGKIDVVTLLLDRQANVDATTKSGITASDLAAAGGHQDIVAILAAAKHQK